GRRDVLEDALDGAPHADGAKAGEHHRVARDPRAVALALEVRRGDELAAAQRPQHAFEIRGRLGVERVVEVPLDVLDAVLQHAAVDLTAGAEERRVQLGHVVGLGERELGYLRIEGELDALEQHGVADRAFLDLPVQDAVADQQLDFLRLALDLAVERVQPVEQLERRALGALGLLPRGALGLPFLPRTGPRALVLEAPGLAAFLERLAHARLGAELVPAGMEPAFQLLRRARAGCRRRATQLEYEALFRLFRIGPRQRGARRQVAQPQHPRPLGGLPDDRGAQLDVGVQELEDPADSGPRDVRVGLVERYDVRGDGAEGVGHGVAFVRFVWLPCCFRHDFSALVPPEGTGRAFSVAP